MKKIISFFTLFLGGSLLLLTLGLLGCGRGNYKFVYKSIKALVFKESSSNDPIPINNFDTITHGSSVLSVKMDIQIVATKGMSGFGNAAFAWSYDDPSYINIEPIKDIIVTPIYDYNSTYVAGYDMTNICLFGYNNNGFGTIATSKDDLIAGLNSSMTDGNISPANSISIKYTTPPDVESLQQFAIEIRLGENSVLRDTTVAFVLKP